MALCVFSTRDSVDVVKPKREIRCRPSFLWWYLLIGILCAVNVKLVSSQWDQFPNIDELGHLPAGVSHWRLGNFDYYRVNPPLVRVVAAIPAWLTQREFEWRLGSSEVGSRPEFVVGLASLRKNRLLLSSSYWGPRLCCVTFSLLGLLTFASWIGLSSGWRVSVIGCAIWCFCPSILAFAGTIGPDLGAVAMGMLLCSSSWNYLHWPTLEHSVLAGLAMGLALLTKLTWLTAVVTLPVTVAVCLIILAKHLPARPFKRRIIDLLMFWFMALLTLNAGYLFEDSFKPLGEYEFCSKMLGGDDCNAEVHGNRFRDTWLLHLPVPVPRNYLLGIDYLKYEVEEKKWSFLMGQWKCGSWPYYYIMTTLFKTPEPTLLAAIIGAGVLVVGIWRKTVEPKVISMFLLLGIPAGVCFMSVSLQGGFSHHHRYVLMIYPFLFALGAYVASPMAVELLRLRVPFLGRKKRSIAIPLAIALVTLSAASSLRIHPHYTSYFNSLSGGPENGFRLLGFSNIDWGQDLLEVDRWIKENPECRPLVMELDYFGVNGELFELPTTLPPNLPSAASIDEVRRSIKETQWWIISVKKLYNLPGENGLEYLQQIKPEDKIAYSYHVYRFDPFTTHGDAEIQVSEKLH